MFKPETHKKESYHAAEKKAGAEKEIRSCEMCEISSSTKIQLSISNPENPQSLGALK